MDINLYNLTIVSCLNLLLFIKYKRFYNVCNCGVRSKLIDNRYFKKTFYTIFNTFLTLTHWHSRHALHARIPANENKAIPIFLASSTHNTELAGRSLRTNPRWSRCWSTNDWRSTHETSLILISFGLSLTSFHYLCRAQKSLVRHSWSKNCERFSQ